MALILGIESTCDETGAAIVADGWDVRSNIVASQVELHAKYRGVVPEIASRQHLRSILPVVREALHNAEITWDQLDAVAVAHRPGLIGSLLIGVTAAKTLAWALHKPLIGVDHVHAHLYSVTLETNAQPPMPAVGLVCSGGHTALYAMRSMDEVSLIGSTRDDAVGEAYDKVAAILGLGYPGGPIIDKLAGQGDPKVLRFPRTFLERRSLDFSFSGLKTAVLYQVRGVPGKAPSTPPPPPTGQALADIAAGFQAACVDVLIEKLRRAIHQTRAKSVIVGGGVSANSGLRKSLPGLNLPVFLPALRYCTDNAAMSAGLGWRYWQSGQFSPLDLDAIPFSRFTQTAISR